MNLEPFRGECRHRVSFDRECLRCNEAAARRVLARLKGQGSRAEQLARVLVWNAAALAVAGGVGNEVR